MRVSGRSHARTMSAKSYPHQHDFARVDAGGKLFPPVGLCHKCGLPFLLGMRTPVCCVVCDFCACQACASAQHEWEHKYGCNFPKGGRSSRPLSSRGNGFADVPLAEGVRAGAPAALTKHGHSQKYARILECLRELEAGVLESAHSTDRYSEELEVHQKLFSKMQPELEAVGQENADLQQHLEAFVQRTQKLESENASHQRTRDDMLVQLQDALLRESEWRKSAERLRTERDASQKTAREAEAQGALLTLQLKHLQEEARAAPAKRGGSRTADNELVRVKDQSADCERSCLQLKRELSAAEHAARQMHSSVCKPFEASRPKGIDADGNDMTNDNSDKAELADLTQEVKTMAEAVHNELQQLRAENRGLALDASSARALHDKEVQRLNSHIDELEQQIETHRQRVVDKEATADSLLQDNREHLAKIQALKEQLDSAGSKCEERNRVVDSREEQPDSENHDTSRQQAAELKAKIKELTDWSVHEESLKRDLRLEMEAMSHRIVDAESKMKLAHTTNSELEVEVVRLRDQCTELTQRLSASKESERQRVADMTKQVSDLENENAALQDAYRALEARLNDMTTSYEGLHKNSADIQKEMDDLKLEKQNAIQREKEQAAELHKLAQLSKDIEDVKSQLQRALFQAQDESRRANEAESLTRNLERQVELLTQLQSGEIDPGPADSKIVSSPATIQDRLDLPRPISAGNVPKTADCDFSVLKPSHQPARVGLGVRITEHPPHRVTELVQGGAAIVAGKLQIGDVLLKIQGKDTRRMTFQQVRALLLGPPGSTVELSVQRKAAGQLTMLTMKLVRSDITPPIPSAPPAPQPDGVNGQSSGGQDNGDELDESHCSRLHLSMRLDDLATHVSPSTALQSIPTSGGK